MLRWNEKSNKHPRTHTHARSHARIHPTQPFDGNGDGNEKKPFHVNIHLHISLVEHIGRKNHFKRTMIFLLFSSMFKCVHEHWTPSKSMLAFWLLNQEIHSQIDIEHWTLNSNNNNYINRIFYVCICLFIRFIFACIIVIWWSCWFGACIHVYFFSSNICVNDSAWVLNFSNIDWAKMVMVSILLAQFLLTQVLHSEIFFQIKFSKS